MDKTPTKRKDMCYTGGPRCFTDATAAFQRAKTEYAANPTEENKEALKNAELDVVLTPEFIAKTQERDPKKAAQLQARYEHSLDGAKNYEMFRKDTSAVLSKLEREKASTEREFGYINERIDQLNKEYQNLQSDAGLGGMVMSSSGQFLSDDDVQHREWEIDQEISGLRQQRTEREDTYKLIEERIKTVKASQEANLERRKQGQPLQYAHMMPEKFAGYFADTERKHFSKDSAGSTFTEAKNLNEVLTLAQKQRKSLSGDDRAELIARGADPSSFAPDKRYLMVKTKGTLGTTLASELPDSAMVTVVQKSEKAKPVCVTEVSQQNETDFATVVVVDNPTLPGTENHPTLLITAYPGASGPTGSNNDLLPHVGKSMTVAEARGIYGRDFTINTVLKKDA